VQQEPVSSWDPGAGISFPPVPPWNPLQTSWRMVSEQHEQIQAELRQNGLDAIILEDVCNIIYPASQDGNCSARGKRLPLPPRRLPFRRRVAWVGGRWPCSPRSVLREGDSALKQGRRVLLSASPWAQRGGQTWVS